MLNAASILHTAARLASGRQHVVCGSREVPVQCLAEGSARLAAQLRGLGVAPGDSVAMFCTNSIEFAALYFAILHAGAVAVPLNVMLKRMQIAKCLSDSGARIIVHAGFSDGDAPLWELREAHRMMGDTLPLAFVSNEVPAYSLTVESGKAWIGDGSGAAGALMHPTEAGATCCIIYTSGTTGQPKGVELTHGNLVCLAYAFSRHMGLGSGDRVLAGLPLFSSFGQVPTLCASLLAGGTLIILPRFSGEAALEAILQHRVTFFGGVPTMIHGVVHAPMPSGCNAGILRSHWRLSFAGGAHAPASLLGAFRERFGIPIVHGYGLTETSAVSSFNPMAGPHKDATIGVPLWGVEMRVVDGAMNDVSVGERGELVVRGPHVMKGYHGEPDVNREVFRGGWLHTGDIATADGEGYFSLVGRIKEMILRGGQNVYPHDVEEMLMTHPAVAMAAVIGIPDERLGEEVAACVVLKEALQITPDELVAWCKERLPAFAYPRVLELRDSLPTGSTGKVLKRDLKIVR